MDARLDDGIDRTGFFAETTVNALEKIDVITCGAASAVISNIRLDRDRECRADCFTKFAGDAAFFTVRLAAQRMQAPKSRRLWRLLVRVLKRDALTIEISIRHRKTLEEFPKGERLDVTD